MKQRTCFDWWLLLFSARAQNLGPRMEAQFLAQAKLQNRFTCQAQLFVALECLWISWSAWMRRTLHVVSAHKMQASLLKATGLASIICFWKSSTFFYRSCFPCVTHKTSVLRSRRWARSVAWPSLVGWCESKLLGPSHKCIATSNKGITTSS